MYKMNCFGNKKVAALKNEVFDLMDTNGDDKLSKDELGIVSKHIWEADIRDAENYVNALKLKNPVTHVHGLLNTKTPSKRHLKSLYGRLPYSTWKDVVIPELQRKEIERLHGTLSN